MGTDGGTPQLRVLICDDAVAYPRLVELWLGNGNGVQPVGVATSATELLERLREAQPDVLLLDLMLPEGPATPALIGDIRREAPDVRVVLVSNLPQPALDEQAAALGVDGWCSKASTPEALLAAVRGAA